MQDYSEFQEEASPEQVHQLQNLCVQAAALETEVDELEEQLKAKQKQLRDTLENTLPQLMQSMGTKEIVLANGTRVQLKEDVRASFPSKDKNPEKREEAFSWLMNNGHTDLIKHKVELKFTRGQREDADKVVAAIRQVGIQVDLKRDDDVHHQTLLAFIREQLKLGEEIPLEKFGAYIQKVVKISKK